MCPVDAFTMVLIAKSAAGRKSSHMFGRLSASSVSMAVSIDFSVLCCLSTGLLDGW